MDKFVVFSDLHLNNWKYGALTIDGWNSRLKAQARLLDDILSFCIRHDVKHVFFCGDMFHNHQTVHAGPLSVACTAFAEFKYHEINLFFLVGNHDLASLTPRIHTLDALYPYGTVIDDAARIDVGNIQVNLLSYTNNRDTILEFLEGCEEDSLVFLHSGVQNVPVNSKGFIIKDEILHPDDIPNRVLHAFTGHYHSHSKVTPKLTIVGSPMQHTWSDAGEDRGWLFCEIEEPGLRIAQMRDSYAPRFIHTTEQTWQDDLKIKASEGINCGDYVKIKTEKYDPELLNHIKSIFNIAAIECDVITPEAKAEVQQRSNFSVSELVDDYIKDKDLPQDVLDMGLALMDGDYEVS
jgi:DNA repair exonuclease SbcCD nuclease subunit